MPLEEGRSRACGLRRTQIATIGLRFNVCLSLEGVIGAKLVGL